jgi:hypothetical protein
MKNHQQSIYKKLQRESEEESMNKGFITDRASTKNDNG